MVDPKICYYLFGLRLPLFAAIFVLSVIFRKQILYLFFKNKYAPYLLIAIPSVASFINILFNDPFFLSDDFDHLLLSFKSGYLDILKRAISPEGIWLGHRIVTGFWLFKLIYDFFGANIYPYISVIFLLHLTNVFLLFNLIKIFVKNRVIPVAFSFLFGFYYLNWNSNIHELLGGLFVLLTLIFALKRINSGRNGPKYSAISLASYLLAVFSKEITFLIFPTIVLLYLYKKEFKKRNFRYLGILSLMFVLYLTFFATGFLRYFGFSSGYKMGFDLIIIGGNLWEYLTMYSGAFRSFAPLMVLAMAAGLVVSFGKSGWTSFIFVVGFFTLIFPALLFSERTSLYYIYTSGLLLFVGLAVIFEDVFGLFRSYYLKVLILVFCLIFVFDVDIKLRDNCFLILSPWGKSQKQEFLVFISKIEGFEKDAKQGQTMSIYATDRTHSLLTQYLNEGKATDLVRAFLYPRGSGYNYEYDSGRKVLEIQKE